MSNIYVANRVKELCQGSGLGNFSLSGAVSGFRPFEDAIPIGEKTCYTVVDGAEWETGIGTLVSTTELSRDTILDSSATGSRVNNHEAGTPTKISLSSNTKTIICAPDATRGIFRDEDGGFAEPSVIRESVFVDTIVDLKAEPGLEDGEAVIVKYGATLNDGLGGVFVWDESDATAPDNIDTFRDDNYATGLWKRQRPPIREYFDDLFEGDAVSANGARIRLFANPKTGAANDWVDYTVDRAASAVRFVMRWAQSGAVNFLSMFTFGDTRDRIEAHVPIVQASRTNSTDMPARAMAWLSGVSRLALSLATPSTGVAATYAEIPLTRGYLVGVYNTVTALKAIDAAAIFENGGRALVLGESALGDCPPFFVEWTSASSATEDLAIVFRPSTGAAASGNGRWLRPSTSISRSFTSGDATPSIKNGEYFVTDGSTGITDFDDAYEGQLFVVERGTADITITHDNTKIDCNGTNLTLTTTRKRAIFIHTGGVHKLIGSGGGSTDTVATIAALKAKTGGYADTVIVQGYTAAGDGGGGVFWWDGASSATDDLGMIIAPTAGGTGRWRRTFDGDAVSVKWFGAKGDGVTDDYTAIAAALAYIDAQSFKLKLIWPAGHFVHGTQIHRDTERNDHWIGNGGNQLDNGTKIRYTGSTATGGIRLTSVIHSIFEHIFFQADNTGLDCVMQLDANDIPGLSCLGNNFTNCQFAPASGRTLAKASVFLKNSAFNTFDGCWFTGSAIALLIGEDNGVDPGTYGNGASHQNKFHKCDFFGDINLRNASLCKWEQCFFDQKFGTSPTQPTCFVTTGDQKTRLIELDGCFAASGASVQTRTFFTQGTDALSTGLLVSNCRLDDSFQVGFNVNTGDAHFRGNTFELNVASAIGIIIQSGAKDVDVGLNDFSAMQTAGRTPLRDFRVAESDMMIVAQQLASDYTVVATGGWEDVATFSTRRFRGGKIKLSYSLTISGADNTTMRARLMINSVAVDETVRGGYLTGGQYLNLSLSGLLYQQLAFSAAVSVKLQIYQVGGTNKATVKANSASVGGSNVTIEHLP